MPDLGAPRYRIGRCLGTGATGVVYEALDLERGVAVALKTLRTADGVSLRRLKHEFRSLAGVSHPNLVVLHELVASESGCFVTMDLVDGVPFLLWVRGTAPVRHRAEPTFEWTAAEPPPPPYAGALPAGRPPVRGRPPPDLQRLREAFRQLARGVHALHLHGCLHRDLKPSNVLVESATGRVVLLDFGLLRALEPPEARGRREPVVGTVPYMSPEQAAGASLTEASDWYAVGTMLFEALTGERPFCGPVSQVLLDKQILEPPDPAALCDVPEDLRALCRGLLAVHPEDRPDGPAVLAAFGATDAESPPSTDLVGREAELAVLAAAWARVRRGESLLATVRGPSGIGKTTLVERFVAGTGAPVLAGRCYEEESVPYRALDSVVDALADRLGADLPPIPELGSVGALFPVLRSPGTPADGPIADPHERRARGFRGLQRLIASLAPLVVFVDDAQWGDADSVGFFAELLSGTPVLVIWAWRTEEQDHSPFLAALRRVRLPEPIRIELGPLSPEASFALARALRPDADDDTVCGIARAAEGHPLFVQELARTGAALDREAPRLDDAIRARVAALDPGARALLEAAAVGGRPLPARILARAVGADDVVPFLAVLRAGRLVRTGRGRVEPYHDRVREAVRAALSPERSRALHRSLAEEIEAARDEDGRDEALAVHWFGAGEPIRALPYAIAAADAAAAALAFDHSAALLDLAVRACADPVERCALTVRLGRALAAAGRPVEAADAWLSLPEIPVALHCDAAAQLLAAGHVERGLATLAAVSARVGVTVPRTRTGQLADVLARRGLTALRAIRGMRWTPRPDPLPAAIEDRLTVCWAAVDGLASIDPLRMSAYQARLLPLALASGSPRPVARALLTEAATLAFAGGTRAWNRAQALLDEAARAVAAADDPVLAGMHRFMAAWLAYHQHRFDEAHQIAVDAESLLLERCAPEATTLVARIRILQCWCHIWRGRLRRIGEIVPRLVEDAEQRGNRYLATSALTDIGYVLGMVEDDPEPVLARLDERERGWQPSGFDLQHLNLAMSRIQLAAYQGRVEEAFALADALWHRWRRSLLARWLMFQGLVLQLRARSALALAERAPERRAELLGVANACTAALARTELPHLATSLALIDCRAMEVAGDRERAVARMKEAVAGLDASGVAAMAAALRRHLGQRIGGDEGRALVERADAWLRDQGVVRPDRFAAGMVMTGHPP